MKAGIGREIISQPADPNQGGGVSPRQEWQRVSGGKRPMIFIVDDDDGVRDSLRLLLECDSFEVREFASCREFLNAGRRDDGDCLILDVQMPGMSGIERLEGMRRCCDMLPVILISGRLDVRVWERARAAGALAILEKPYRAAEILDLVRRALGSGSHFATGKWPSRRPNPHSLARVRKSRQVGECA